MIRLTRYKKNPILKPNPKNKWESVAVLNPGVVLKDGKVYMLYRAVGEYDAYISRLGLAVSDDGFKFKRVSNKPLIVPSKRYDKWACEDPRITQIGDTYYITYVGISRRLWHKGKPTQESIKHVTSRTILLSTKDFKKFERHGIMAPKNSDNRDVVLFPEKINGKYVMMHRPQRWSKNWIDIPLSKQFPLEVPFSYEHLPRRPAMWLAYSYNLKHWFDHRIVVRSTHKEDEKTGAGPPPIKTDKGWLLIYHHVDMDETIKGKRKYVYTAKAALLDLKDPSKMIAKIPYHILEPKEDYEIKGDVGNVVFPTGTVIKDGTLFIYYGTADTRIGVATVKLKKLLDELMKHKLVKRKAKRSPPSTT
jgi:predicted GH43/DUF377 family glycosyl hydrolase